MKNKTKKNENDFLEGLSHKKIYNLEEILKILDLTCSSTPNYMVILYERLYTEKYKIYAVFVNAFWGWLFLFFG